MGLKPKNCVFWTYRDYSLYLLSLHVIYLLQDWINRHSSIFLSEEERTGQAAEDDEEIESFTAENFEADVATENAEPTQTEKDEL